MPVDATPEEVEAGHAFYTKRSLAVYDLAILGFFSRLAWRCPSRRIQDHYDAHISGNHLDVGVGTGYFLDHARFPVPDPRIALMDLNESCLDVAARRIARFGPEVHRANVLEPISLELEPFDSVGMNYLLHCLPGDIRTKGEAVFGNMKRLLNQGGVVFGATLLHDGVRRNWFARQVMKRNNDHGIFSNASDDLDGLNEVLRGNFVEPRIDVVGCVAVFAARVD
jgi:ubiquinone/menaquinone biosynthesis C-methylase UbiE